MHWHTATRRMRTARPVINLAEWTNINSSKFSSGIGAFLHSWDVESGEPNLSSIGPLRFAYGRRCFCCNLHEPLLPTFFLFDSCFPFYYHCVFPPSITKFIIKLSLIISSFFLSLRSLLLLHDTHSLCTLALVR